MSKSYKVLSPSGFVDFAGIQKINTQQISTFYFLMMAQKIKMFVKS